jgi:hypothetical protein
MMPDISDLVIAWLISKIFIETELGRLAQRFGSGSRQSLFQEHTAALRFDGYGNIDDA